MPATEDEARRLVDLYLRPAHPDIFIGSASLNQTWTAYNVNVTVNGEQRVVKVTGYASSEVTLTP